MKAIFTVLLMFSPLTLLADAAPAASSIREGLSPFIPLIMIFGVFYFLIMRPQQKKQKDQQKFISELKRGDMVVTNAGIIGTIRTVSDKFVGLEVDEGVTLKVLRTQILENAANLKVVATTKEATT